MGIRSILIGSVSAAALLSGVAHAQTNPETSAAAAETQTDEITVVGYREALQEALRTKRNADAIVDSVSAEDIGKFPNTNVAEALTLVPGVTVDRQFGQGEKVSILGTDPALNRTLLNGQTVASADWFILDTPGRTFNYALLAPQIVGRVDVYKTPEARIDEGSIGGTVIVHTRDPLDLEPLEVAGSLGYLYNDRSEEGDIQGSALLSWRNEARTVGLIASFQRSKDELRRDGLESYGTIAAGEWAGGNASNPIDSRDRFCTGDCADTLTANLDARSPNAFGTSYFAQGRERLSYSAAAQWKPVPEALIEFEYLGIDATYDNLNQSMFAFQGNTWNSLGQLTDIEVEDGIVTRASFTNALSVLDVQYREAEMKSDTYHLTLGWDGDGWDVNAEAGISKADGGTKRQVFLEFLNWADYTVDLSGAPGEPGSISYATDVLGNPDAFSTDAGWSGNLVEKPTTDKERYAQLDFGYDLPGDITRIQAGYKFRRHETGQRYSGISLNGITVAASELDTSPAANNYLSGFNGVNEQMRDRFIISGPAMLDYVQSGTLPTPSQFAAAEFTAGNWDITEDVHALYAQANFDTGTIRGNFGVRYVHTETESAGYVCNPGAACTSEDDWTWQTTDRSYDNVLPSVNIAVDAAPDLIVRFAASQVIARPNYADMTNYFWLSDQILTGGGGNPDLDPYKANNVNASAEWYFQPGAILAAEVFYKDIGNYILQQTAPEDYFNQDQGVITTYQISRPYNAGSAEVKGLALSYQQNLPYGFGMVANYTYSDGEGQDGRKLPYNSTHQVNLSPYFEQGPISLRATFTWRSEYFTGIDRGDEMYVDETENLDLSATYRFTDYLSFTASAMNLTDSEYYAYANTPALPRGVYRSGRKFLGSVNVTF